MVAGLALAACNPHAAGPPSAGAAAAPSCLPGERGYLRASLRGAMETDLDWRGATLQCEGGARPEGRGLRVSFAGPADAQGRQLRLVFGVAAKPGAAQTHAAATNVTVIVEGRNLVYATQGDAKCTIEALEQKALPTDPRRFRIAARGYCIDPAATLDGAAHLYLNRFDFAGVARFEEDELHATSPPH
jgi:hypothetical protein